MLPRSTRELERLAACVCSWSSAAFSAAVRVLSSFWAEASFALTSSFFFLSSVRVAERSLSLLLASALLGEFALLALDLRERLDLLTAQLVHRGRLVEVVVRVRGQEQLDRGVDTPGAVLGARHRAEAVPELVELLLAAGDVVLDGGDLLLELLLLLLGPVELLGGLLGLLVESVDLRLDLVLVGLLARRGVRGLGAENNGGSGCGGQHSDARAARLLRSTMGRHGVELLLLSDHPFGGSRPDPSDVSVISSNPHTKKCRHSKHSLHITNMQ